MRAGSKSSSSARCDWMRVKTSSRVIGALHRRGGLGRAWSGGAAPGPRGPQGPARTPDEVPAHAARGEQDRLREPVPREAPVGHHAELAQPEQVGAAGALGVDLVTEAA